MLTVNKINDGITLFLNHQSSNQTSNNYRKHNMKGVLFYFNMLGESEYKSLVSNYCIQAKKDHTIIDITNYDEAISTVKKDTLKQNISLLLSEKFIENNFPKHQIKDGFLNFFQSSKNLKNISYQKTNPKSSSLSYEIFNTPYKNNNLDKLYIESKILELIHNEFKLLIHPQIKNTTVKFSKQDKEAIFHAREILLNSLSNPPSMKELAKMVAINDLKLKMGFRKFFNQSPYSISLEHRLQEAKRLLQTSEMNINEIAEQIGYKHATNFSNIFYKKFGIRPKELMKSRKYYY